MVSSLVVLPEELLNCTRLSLEFGLRSEHVGRQWRTQNEFGVGAKCVSGGTSSINLQILNIFF
jgi:hypothetical protein